MLREIEEYVVKLMAPASGAASRSGERGECDAVTGTALGVRLLEILLFCSHASRVLQIGVGCGEQTLRVVLSATDMEILVLEEDADRVQVTRALLDREKVTGRVEFAGFDALDTLAQGQLRFDALLLDTDPRSSRRYLDHLLPIIEVGGLIVIQNMLLGGQIIEPDPGADETLMRAQDALNGYFLMHPQLRATILPVADGVGVATKTQPLMTELGGPF